ncbi:MAG TPA: hypothetical protein VFT93_06210, partial [Candidatus Eisenbacteria bacterium]|nr:hypothetical protein [Candidatus Eisenbacteria bacterium]
PPLATAATAAPLAAPVAVVAWATDDTVAPCVLEKDVLVAGMLDHLELWNPELFEKYLQSSPRTYEEIAGELLL